MRRSSSVSVCAVSALLLRTAIRREEPHVHVLHDLMQTGRVRCHIRAKLPNGEARRREALLDTLGVNVVLRRWIDRMRRLIDDFLYYVNHLPSIMRLRNSSLLVLIKSGRSFLQVEQTLLRSICLPSTNRSQGACRWPERTVRPPAGGRSPHMVRTNVVVDFCTIMLATAPCLGDEPVAPQMTACQPVSVNDVGQQIVHHLIEQAGVESVHLFAHWRRP